jgi:hypothetical protein
MNQNSICENCPFEQKIQDLEKRLDNNSIQHKEFYEKIGRSNTDTAVILARLDQMEKTSGDSFQRLENNVESVRNDVKEIHKNFNDKFDMVEVEIKDINEKPAKRWELVICVALTTIVGAFVTYLLTKGGL